MRISSRGEYGVRALFELALRRGQGPIPLKLVAERQGISEHYLEQLMGTLRKGGLVTSVRGAQGGYELAAPPEEIRIGDIIRILEGPLSIASAGGETEGEPLERLVLQEMWRRMADRINSVLHEMSLADLVEEVERLRAQSGAHMYHI